MTKILIFGDSIAWGAFDEKYGGWVERLKAHFLKDYNKQKVGVYNFSVSSYTIKDILESLENDIKKIEKVEANGIILFSIGVNDASFNNKEEQVVPIKEFEANLNKIIKIAERHSKRIIFTGLFNVKKELVNSRGKNKFLNNDAVVEYNNVLEKITKENKLEFIPFFNLLNNFRKFWRFNSSLIKIFWIFYIQ